jgi:alpha/beta superfamily hydrolase
MKIPVSHGHLEASWRNPAGDPRGGALFCHPHPLHGGTMNTKAVYRASQAFNDVGMRSLRFNFRGVGYSTGTFEDGIGELDDVRAALDWLELGARGLPLVVGGLSFGSLVALSVGAEDSRVKALVALGTPIHIYDYSFLAGTIKPILVVQGEEDEYGLAQEVVEVLGGLGGHITVQAIPGAGHLFEGHFEEIRTVIREFFTSGPGAETLSATGAPAGEERII